MILTRSQAQQGQAILAHAFYHISDGRANKFAHEYLRQSYLELGYILGSDWAFNHQSEVAK